MSNLKNVFKEVKPSVIIFLAVLALILSYFTLYSRITNILYLKLPNYQCGLEVLDDVNGQAIPNREVWIEQIILDGKTAMKQVMEFATENVGFEYRDASQYGYSCDVIVNTKGQDGRLSFEWKGGSENSITFWKQNLSGKVHIQLSKESEVIQDDILDLYSEAGDERYEYKLEASIVMPVAWRAIRFVCVLLGGVVLFFLSLLGIGKIITKEERQ